MSKLCPGCLYHVRWYHRKGGGESPFNSAWHRGCAIASDGENKRAYKFINALCVKYGLPLPADLYALSQPQPQLQDIGDEKMRDFRERYKIDGRDRILMKNIYNPDLIVEVFGI